MHKSLIIRKFLFIAILLNLSYCGKKETPDFIDPGVAGYDIGQLVIEEDGLPAKPPLSVQQQHSIYDYAGLLNPGDRRRLEYKISKYHDSTSTQILIATINKYEYSLSNFATKWAQKWGVGQKGKDNGIFILISKDDRHITIRTGYGVEHLLTDFYCKRIIETDITPNFKEEKYYEGLDAAITSIQQALEGEYEPYKETWFEKLITFVIMLLIIFYILATIYCFFASFFGKCETSDSDSSGSFWDSDGSSWGSSSGWSDSDDSGGGFSGGFGGGSFGGGGASGSW